MHNLFVFDLDGTLVDSVEDLVRSVNATLAHLGRPELPPALIASYVGNGAPVLIRRALGNDATDELAETALAYFLDYYRDHMLDYTRPYPGVEQGLQAIFETRAPMAVLTNKPVRFSQEMLRRLGWSEMFFRVYGGNSFDTKKPHPRGLEALLEEAAVRPEAALMIGDSAIDIQTARNAGVAACGVTYGIQPESFAEVPPDFLVDSLEELPSALARWRLRSISDSV